MEEKNIEQLFEPKRISIELTKENASFKVNSGGLVSMDFINHKGEQEHLDRVVIFRSFPITNPDEFLSVREPDSKMAGRGKELGMIRRLSDMDEESIEAIMVELNVRYFSPEITKIKSFKSKFGYQYWGVVTSSGEVEVVITNPFVNIRMLEDGRVLMKDIEGNNFVIKNVGELDAQSRKFIEIYL